MGIMTLAGVILGTWGSTEVLGKFVFKSLDNKVLCALCGIGICMGAKGLSSLSEAPMALSWTEAGVYGILTAILAAGLHDKVIEPMIVAKKK